MTTQTKGNKPMPDMRIYVTDEQRKQMDRLQDRVSAVGINLLDNRGNRSYSQLIRFALTVLEGHLDAIEKGRDDERRD